MKRIRTDLVVIGAGPGGYTAAFYAADKGKKVILVEQDERLGGVCLNAGCIPSKAFLHATEVMRDAQVSAKRGITYGAPAMDLEKLRAWKESILQKLSEGIRTLGANREVTILRGRGYFEDSHTLRVETEKGQKFIEYGAVIIATGSKPVLPPVFDLGNERVMTSTEALALKEIPRNLLVVGGGYIGLELGTVYATLGSQVVLEEALPSFLPGTDPDLSRPVQHFAGTHFKAVRLNTKVLEMATRGKQIKVISKTGEEENITEFFDRVLVAIGRSPFYDDLGLENTKVERDEKGFIRVNEKQETSDPGVYAIGDVCGGMLLAHKASREGRIAVEALCNEETVSQNMVVPAVIFTDPEIAWCGLTEIEAKKKGLTVSVAKFPWTASGRALTFDHPEGMTKLIIDPASERILGAGISGRHAGELIAEGVFAIEMGATAKDLAESIHPHPTLSETLMECAESFYGYATHTLRKRSPPPKGIDAKNS